MLVTPREREEGCADIVTFKREIPVEELIFTNTVDAAMGFVVLFLLPIISILCVLAANDTTWKGYAFPIISVSLAGFYDANQRRCKNQAGNKKLRFRKRITAAAFVLVCIIRLITEKVTVFHLIPPILLFFSGILVLKEVYRRISVEWDAWKFANALDDLLTKVVKKLPGNRGRKE